MYRIYDKVEAIRNIQKYLRSLGNTDFSIAPSGVYDENTRLSVIDFQKSRGLVPTGTVDYDTFTILKAEYDNATNRYRVREATDSFISFPILPGESRDELLHINRLLKSILDYYGFTHRLRESNFYSKETSDSVMLLRRVYILDDVDLIDEEFYRRMIIEHDSITASQNYLS